MLQCGMASLRSQGFVPKMVKLDTGNTVYAFTFQEWLDIFQSFAKCLGLFRACTWAEFHALPQFMQDAFPPHPNDPESSAMRYAVEIAALNLLGGGGEQIEVPEIRQAGFNPPVKRNFWGAIIG